MVAAASGEILASLNPCMPATGSKSRTESSILHVALDGIKSQRHSANVGTQSTRLETSQMH